MGHWVMHNGSWVVVSMGQWVMVGVGVTIFYRNPQKADPWLISRVLSHYACKSVHAFCRYRLFDEKRDTTKIHREVIFHLFAGILQH